MMNAATAQSGLQQAIEQSLGHKLLEEWGLWYRDDREGRESWNVKPRIDPGRHGDPPERARFIDKLIAQHRLKYWVDWRVIAHRYMGDKMPWEIASKMGGTRDGWSEGRVLAVIGMMCGMVEREYCDWRESLTRRRKFGKYAPSYAGFVRP